MRRIVAAAVLAVMMTGCGNQSDDAGSIIRPLYAGAVECGTWWGIIDRSIPVQPDGVVVHDGEREAVLRAWVHESPQFADRFNRLVAGECGPAPHSRP